VFAKYSDSGSYKGDDEEEKGKISLGFQLSAL